ncbi:MAG: CidA/LrgA family protein [Acidihalobacter sp.]
MDTNRSQSRRRRTVRRSLPLQILLLIAFWWIGESLALASGLPVPGGIVGMLLVLALLFTRRMRLRRMRRGAEWFLAEILLFFVPAVLAVCAHQRFFGWVGLEILLTLLVGTLCVGGVTALTVELCHRWRLNHAASRPARD